MEQGLAVCVHFLRYAPLAQARGGRVVVECPGGLRPLFSTCPGIDWLVAEGDPLPAFDVQCPLLSLPGLLGTTRETVPGAVPYLSTDPGRVARWRAVLTSEPGFKVGVAWQGNPHFQWDRHRSIPLAAFEPLAKVEGVRLYSLQKVFGLEQVDRVRGRFEVRSLDGLDEEGGWFLDTAAVMTGLDLVVSADTAAAHLAGALGVPVWVGLAAVADWRWMTSLDDTPWYPTMRLFRQEKLGDWKGVFARMAEELKVLVARRRRPLARVEVSPGELLDRITILQIKSERVTDPEKVAFVIAELAALREARDRDLSASGDVGELAAALRAVNEELWEAEDGLRACERDGDFGPRFVALARSVYTANDRRAALKGRVNAVLDSPFREPKVYGRCR